MGNRISYEREAGGQDNNGSSSNVCYPDPITLTRGVVAVHYSDELKTDNDR